MTLESPSEPIKILLLDNDALVRAGIKLVLEHQSLLKVFIQEGDEQDALKLATEKQPDIVLLRVQTEGSMFPEILPKLVKALNQPRIILITSRTDSEFNIQAVNGGAMGVVLTKQHPEVLIKAIEKVHAGEVWLDRTLIASVFAKNIQIQHRVDPKTRKKASLSKRERGGNRVGGGGVKESTNRRSTIS